MGEGATNSNWENLERSTMEGGFWAGLWQLKWHFLGREGIRWFQAEGGALWLAVLMLPSLSWPHSLCSVEACSFCSALAPGYMLWTLLVNSTGLDSSPGGILGHWELREQTAFPARVVRPRRRDGSVFPRKFWDRLLKDWYIPPKNQMKKKKRKHFSFSYVCIPNSTTHKQSALSWFCCQSAYPIFWSFWKWCQMIIFLITYSSYHFSIVYHLVIIACLV